MSDQPTRDESAASFSERVTIDTLADRASIPSFDVNQGEWKPETALRLEGHFTDARGNEYLPVHLPVVILIGPEGKEEPRTIVLYHKSNGQRDPVFDKDIFNKLQPYDPSTIIREGGKVKLDLITRIEGSLTSAAPVFEIETIQAGPLA